MMDFLVLAMNITHTSQPHLTKNWKLIPKAILIMGLKMRYR